MAGTFAPDPSGSGASPIAIAGGVWLLFGTVTFSGSYTTGGETIELARFIPQLSTLRRVVALGNIRGYLPEFVLSNKLKLWVPNPTGPATAEHGAVAYDADITASAVPVAFLCK